MSYVDRITETLLPKSVSGTLKGAILEWYFTGNCTILEAHETAECKLCGHAGLKNEFEIRNRLNGRTLWTGSECIKKFEIPALDENGNFVVGRAATKLIDKALRDLVAKQRLERVLVAFGRLLSTESADHRVPMERFHQIYEYRKRLTPKQFVYLIGRLDANRVQYDRRDFNVQLQSAAARQGIVAMPRSDLSKLWPSLAPKQKEWVRGERGDCPD